MSEKLRVTRRAFIKTGAIAVAAIPFLGAFGRGVLAAPAKKEAALPPGEEPVKEDDPVASAIGYKQDGKKADLAKYPQAKGKAGITQTCDNCNLYTKLNDGWGKCQMLPKGVVAAKGWCGSWQEKIKKS